MITKRPQWRQPLLPPSLEIALVIIWGGISWAIPRAQTQFEFRLGLSVVVFGPIALKLFKIVDQKRRNRLIQGAISGDKAKFPDEEELFLYLRSFEGVRRYLWRERILYALRFSVRTLLAQWGWRTATFVPILDRETEDLEYRLYATLHKRGTFVAIGDRYQSFGAAKLNSSDATWKEDFFWCCRRSTAILCQLDDTSSLLWKVEQIIGMDDVADRAFVLLPPNASATRFHDVQSFCRNKGLQLPYHSSRGWVLCLGDSSGIADYWNFMSLLDANSGEVSRAFANARRERAEVEAAPAPQVRASVIFGRSVVRELGYFGGVVLLVLRKLSWIAIFFVSIHVFVTWFRG